ncbi:MAG: response regulator, partial [Leptospiraceae bacterium]|nr:response regulator [Leptospiraceae bacterium]
MSLQEIDPNKIISAVGKVKLGLNLQTNLPIKVFIIDDDALQRETLNKFLTEFGFDVIGESEDGNSAVNELSNFSSGSSPDIICIDQEMPGLKGTDVIPKIQKLLPKSKILMVSGTTDKDLVKEVIRLKVNGYLKKPVEKFRIFEKLAIILRRQDLLEGHIKLKSKVIDIDKLEIPPITSVFTKILGFDIENPDNGIIEFEKIIQPDSTISMLLLKIANSSVYSQPKKVSTLKEALNLIGLKNSKNIILIELNKLINKKLDDPSFVTYLRT